MTPKSIFSATFLFSPLLILTGAIVFRGNFIDGSLGEYLNCVGCYGKFAIYSDLLVLTLVSSFLFLSLLKPGFASVLSRFAALSLVLFYLLDILVFQYFNKRLFFSDISIYAVQWGPIWDHLHGFLDSRWLAIALLATISIFSMFFVFLRFESNRLMTTLALGISLASGLLYATKPDTNYINYWILDNFLLANMETDEPKMYSQQMIERTRDFGTPGNNCYEGLNQRPNIIVLVVESWSPYQSKLLSGIEDWTPKLDQLALDNHYFSQFFANGFTTNNGLISSLTSIQLDAVFENPFLRDDSFEATWHFPESIPNLVKNYGYTSAFLTTGPLDFTGKGPWLESLKFDYVEGNEAAFYKDWPKISFQAASDEALFKRSLEWISNQQKPFFLAIENVSTHPPYIDPVSGNRSMEKAFNFFDREAYSFYNQLKDTGFFSNGLLIIVSDHRNMNLVSNAEIEHFGVKAASLVPMILVAPMLDSDLPNEIPEIYQQSDFFFSVSQLLRSGQVCARSNESSIFEPRPDLDKCALHLRGLEKGTVDTHCRAASGRVLLKGDESDFIANEGLSDKQQSKLLDIIAWQRMQLYENQKNQPAPEQD
jgi:lipoteichoic acid synthase